MRVLLVNSHGSDETVGGAEGYVARLADGLRRHGHEVRMIAAFPGDHRDGTSVLHPQDWRTSGVRRVRNHLGDLASLRHERLTRMIAAADPAVVHTHNLPGISTSVWPSSARLGVPVVHTLHDYYLLCPRVTLHAPDGTPCCPHQRLCSVRTRRLGRWAGIVGDVIGVSDHVVARHAQLFPGARRHVIRHAIPPAGLGSVAPPGPLRHVGFIGSLEPTKGVELLVGAAPLLKETGVVLRIAGDGRLRDLVAAAAARGVLEYAGYVAGPDKARFVGGCDVGIVPSLWEEPGGPPYSVLDWLGAGRPVLSTRRGGLEEVADRVPGVIGVDPEPEAVAAAVRRLRSPADWRAAVASIRPPEPAQDSERWISEHEGVYRLAAASRERSLRST